MAYRLINPALEGYQRLWRTFQVDRNLSDDWLEQLNRLRCFDLVSVCEGHHDCNDCYPQIILSAQIAAVKRVKSILVPLRPILDNWVSPDTSYRLTCTVSISNQSEDCFLYDRVTLSLRRTVSRCAADMDDPVKIWFSGVVRLATMLDQLIVNNPYNSEEHEGYDNGTE